MKTLKLCKLQAMFHNAFIKPPKIISSQFLEHFCRHFNSISKDLKKKSGSFFKNLVNKTATQKCQKMLLSKADQNSRQQNSATVSAQFHFRLYSKNSLQTM